MYPSSFILQECISVNVYVAAILILLVALLQAEFLPAILPNLNQFIPDLTLLVVLVWALTLRWQWSLPLAFFTGLALDLMNPALYPVGMNALLYTVVALLVGFLSQRSFSSGIVRAVPITLGAVLAYRFLLLLGQGIVGYNNWQFSTITQVILPVAVIDAALMLVVFVVVRAISRIGAPQE